MRNRIWPCGTGGRCSAVLDTLTWIFHSLARTDVQAHKVETERWSFGTVLHFGGYFLRVMGTRLHMLRNALYHASAVVRHDGAKLAGDVYGVAHCPTRGLHHLLFIAHDYSKARTANLIEQVSLGLHPGSETCRFVREENSNEKHVWTGGDDGKGTTCCGREFGLRVVLRPAHVDVETHKDVQAHTDVRMEKETHRLFLFPSWFLCGVTTRRVRVLAGLLTIEGLEVHARTCRQILRLKGHCFFTPGLCALFFLFCESEARVPDTSLGSGGLVCLERRFGKRFGLVCCSSGVSLQFDGRGPGTFARVC